jgi:hypothetical protein
MYKVYGRLQNHPDSTMPPPAFNPKAGMGQRQSRTNRQRNRLLRHTTNNDDIPTEQTIYEYEKKLHSLSLNSTGVTEKINKHKFRKNKQKKWLRAGLKPDLRGDSSSLLYFTLLRNKFKSFRIANCFGTEVRGQHPGD